MARAREVGPRPRSDVYAGMLALTALAMTVGVAVLALEANEYDWDSQPKAGPAITLPSTAPTLKVPAGG